MTEFMPFETKMRLYKSLESDDSGSRDKLIAEIDRLETRIRDLEVAMNVIITHVNSIKPKTTR